MRASAALPSVGADTQPAAVPFLKWAGGKRQLLPQLRRFVPKTFSGYCEAFLGSGALFFDVAAADRLRNLPTVLIDNNSDLIGTYKAVAHNPEGIINVLNALAEAHVTRGSDLYYEVRDKRFNPARARRYGKKNGAAYPDELAALLVYLNRTCFNGLFRQNAKGEFNVPAGRYAKPRICDDENLRRVSALLRQPNVSIVEDTFERVGEIARPGEFIYFDPPYAPVSQTSHFRSYTADGFSSDQQKRLQRLVIDLSRRGCWVLLSNSVAPQVKALYDTNREARTAGLRAYRVPARRAINCDGTSRGTVEEYLVSNVNPV